MKTRIALLTIFLMCVGCSTDVVNRTDQKLLFGSSELIYNAPITAAEATRLGAYLEHEEFFTSGDSKTVQLRRPDKSYEFRIIIKKGLEHDPETIAVMKAISQELSAKVFNGQQVDIHLCDDMLRTVRVVVALIDLPVRE